MNPNEKTPEQRQAEHEAIRAMQREVVSKISPKDMNEHDLKLATHLVMEDLREDVSALENKVANLGTVAKQAAGAELEIALRAVQSVERALVHLHALATR